MAQEDRQEAGEIRLQADRETQGGRIRTMPDRTAAMPDSPVVRSPDTTSQDSGP